MKKQIFNILTCLFLLSACTIPFPLQATRIPLERTTTLSLSSQKQVIIDTPTQPVSATPTATVPDTLTPSPTTPPTFTPTLTFTETATSTLTPTLSSTPTITDTPTITLTPTFDFPVAVVNQMAHCRYGPSKAYLHAADLYAGDSGTVRGRFQNSAWLYVKFDKLKYHCWVSPSVLDVTGDISKLYYTKPNLEKVGSNMYGPPQDVGATREGNMVTISWNRLKMTVDDDRGYFIEAWVCQNGAYIWWTVSFPDQYTTHYTVQDDTGCSQPSSGEIRSVEKHGFSEAVKISWP